MALTEITSKSVKDGEIVNADVNASAAIAKSKLASLDIVNADVNASAAIAASKISGLAASATTDTTNATNIGSGTLPAARIGDDSIVEDKLDIHNAPSGTDKYLKYTSNGMEWATASSSPDWQSFQAEMVTDVTHGTGAWNLVKFNAQNWDTDSNYDHTDGDWYYQAPAAGKYWYKVSLRIIQLGQDNNIEVSLYKDTGSGYVQQKKTLRFNYQPKSGNHDCTVETTGLIELGSGDKVRVYAHHSHGSDRDLDDNYCLFEMFKLDGA